MSKRPQCTFDAHEKLYAVHLTSFQMNTIQSALWDYDSKHRSNEDLDQEMRDLRLNNVRESLAAIRPVSIEADNDWWYGLGYSDGRWGSDPKTFTTTDPYVQEYRKGFRAGAKAALDERLSALEEVA